MRTPLCSQYAIAVRREIKYVFRNTDPETLRALLRSELEQVSYSDKPFSRVNSLYFDTETYTSYRDSVEGNDRRVKLRVRWYGDARTPSPCSLEIKHRRGDMCVKERITLPGITNAWNKTPRDFTSIVTRTLIASNKTRWQHYAYPTVFISYQREYFIDIKTGIRCTLDYGLEYQNTHISTAPLLHTMNSLGSTVIVEIKTRTTDAYGEHFPAFLKEWRMQKSSKYVSAIHHCFSFA
ncbi:polyphosphate polymerase domain-containing protein [Candidatus Uhrbacteria bacterium]|nr:polyphosphate polymerase domain-containing protein [Candidatus Uhrbacteria bacterium]